MIMTHVADCDPSGLPGNRSNRIERVELQGGGGPSSAKTRLTFASVRSTRVRISSPAGHLLGRHGGGPMRPAKGLRRTRSQKQLIRQPACRCGSACLRCSNSRKQLQGFDGVLAPTPRRRRSTGPCSSFPASRPEPSVQVRQRPTDGRASTHPRQCQFKLVQQFRQTRFPCSLSCELPLLHKAAPL